MFARRRVIRKSGIDEGSSGGSHQRPLLPIERYHPLPLQKLLCVADRVFPPLAKTLAIDNEFDRVITQIGQNLLDTGVKFSRGQGSLGQNVNDGVRVKTVRGAIPHLGSKELNSGFPQLLIEPLPEFRSGRTLDAIEFVHQLIADLGNVIQQFRAYLATDAPIRFKIGSDSPNQSWLAQPNTVLVVHFQT